MTRARSGSFYCPIPDESVLSIAQKAAISTAPTATSSSATVSPVGGRLRRHARSQSMSTAFELAVQKQQQQQHHLTPSDTPAARNSVGAICHDKTTVQALAPTLSIPMCKRYPWSPIKPSPLRRVASTGSKPLPPSALWTTHTELLPLYDDTTTSQLPAVYRTNHVDVAVVSRQSYYRHTLRAAFLAGPMAEKARIYGLRVAWCIYGDIKEQLAKEIFVTGAHAGHSLSSPSRHRQTSSLSISTVDSDVLDHVEVVQLEPEEMIRSRPVSPARTAFEWAVQEPLMKEDDAFESPELEEDDEDEEDSLSEYSSFSDTSSDTESIEELEFDHEFGLDFGIHED